MMKHILLILTLFLPQIASAQMLDWYKVQEPTSHSPKIYGSHTAGCMDGGMRLPESGVGYVLGDVHDNRAYGQPEMLDYITKLANNVYKDTGRTLIISDISSPRGGPVPITSSLHQSHQTGLDVDIWFRSAKKTENAHKIKQVNMLDGKYNRVNSSWGDAQVTMLKDAALLDGVDRIFVNPIIKNELCRNYAGEEWMRKIRPWWGHAAHFHVRLMCPKNNSECKMQQPVPEGSGCGKDLEWWFSDEAKQGTGTKEPRKPPILPKECDAVFSRK